MISQFENITFDIYKMFFCASEVKVKTMGASHSLQMIQIELR